MNHSLTYLATASTASPRTTAIVMGGTVIFLILVGVLLHRSNQQKKALAAMAAKNGWQVLTPDDATLGSCVPDYIKKVQTGHSYSQAYQAQVDGQGIVFFRYRYQIPTATINNENAGDSWVPSAMVAFEVPQNFSPLLLRYHSHFNTIGHPAGFEKFNLEGDFGKHFDAFAPAGSSVETLSLLTPDLMAFLIDNTRPYQNIQIDGHRVIIEVEAGAISPSKVIGLLNYANSLGGMLRAKPLTDSSPID